MKKLMAATALVALTITAGFAFAGAPIRGVIVKGGKPGCYAKSSSSSSLNKLVGGLTHSTEKCGASSSSGHAGSLPPVESKATSGVAMTINGAMDARASSSESAVPQPKNVLKIKTKNNIKNDRAAASSSTSTGFTANSASPH